MYINLDNLIAKINKTVETHRIEEGVYTRWLWKDEKGNRVLGKNEYGCADAANILYSTGAFPRCPEKRAKWVEALQSMQDPQTGLFREATHHMIHTTAHCAAALELFDAQPLYPITALEPFLKIERMEQMLDGLNWHKDPWGASHRGAGMYAAMVITRMVDKEWQNAYFKWLDDRCDPEIGMGMRHGGSPVYHHMGGWFHYLFNHEYARMPIPHPEKLIDSCIDLYVNKKMGDDFAQRVGFAEIDWIFCMNRASRQTKYRYDEVKELIRDCGKTLIEWMDSVDADTHDGFNDLHALFGSVCALAELQLALPGEIVSTVPLKLVLDRRPFI